MLKEIKNKRKNKHGKKTEKWMKQEIDTEMKKKLLGIFSDENMKKGKKEGRERMREED